MHIVSLQYKKKRTGAEVEITLDDGNAFALDADLVVQFHLSTGLRIAEEDVTRLKNAQSHLSARRRLIGYLALRRKSSLEARQYLQQRGFPEDAIAAAVTTALEQGYLNDEQYAQAYVRTQERTAKKGLRALRQELLARGIDRSTTEEALAPVADPEAQLEAARLLAAKKLTGLAREPDRTKAMHKLHQFLLRKGYDPDVISRVIRECYSEFEE